MKVYIHKNGDREIHKNGQVMVLTEEEFDKILVETTMDSLKKEGVFKKQ